MALSDELISQFAKMVVKQEEKPDTGNVVTGTAKLYQGDIYVQLDGSDQLTPIASSTAGMKDGDRVTVLIKDHSATVTGNATSPSAGKDDIDSVQGQIDDVSDQISEFEIVIADKVDVDQLNAVSGRIDDLVSENVTITGKLDAAEAEIDSLQATNVEITGKLDAAEAEIDDLTANMLTAEVADLKYATIESLDATNADIYNLEAVYGEFEQLTTTKLNAIEGSIADLDTEKLDAESADIRYAQIDFANIGIAAVEELFSKSGIIGDLVVSEGHITGELVGVTIKGDLIEGNTIKADKLVVLGSDGLYYKLNVNGESVAAEQTEYNSLNGSVITANTITAEKINVNDLVAFNATIGGFHISDDAIYSGAKASPDNTTRGTYLGSDGQLSIGDQNQYLKFYKDTDGSWKLEISANAIKMGTTSITDYIDENIGNAGKITDGLCGSTISVGENGGKPPYKTVVYGNTRQNLWVNTSGTHNGVAVSANTNGSITLSGTSTNGVWVGYRARYTLRPGSTYTLTVDKAPQADVYFRVESRDAENASTQVGAVYSGRLTHTFTVPDDSAYCNFLVNVQATGATVSGTYRIMLNEGATAEPWCPPGLNGVDELAIVVSNGNLWRNPTGNVDGITFFENADGSLDITGTPTSSFGTPKSKERLLKPSTTYTVTSNIVVGGGTTSTANGCLSVYFYDSSGTVIDGWVDFAMSTATLTKTFETPPDTYTVRCQLYTGSNLRAFDIHGLRVMLNEGSEAEPWVRPDTATATPIDLSGHILNSLPDGTRDELSVDATGAATLVKRVGTMTFDGDEGFSGSNSDHGYYNYLVTGQAGDYGQQLSTMNDKLFTANPYSVDGCCLTAFERGSAEEIRFRVPNATSVETAESWLQLNNMRVLYRLYTPQEISLGRIEMPSLPADQATVFFSAPVSVEGCVDWWTVEGAKVADAMFAADKAEQGSVESQTVTYQAGSSATAPPTGSWLATPPSVGQGQYLWTRTVTTYVSGKTVTAYSVARQGQNGSPGDDGRGISSTTITYQAHSSQTSAPTGTWSSSVPALSASKPYLWTRTVIKYTDNTTSTVYTVGSTLEGVEIGGRNILLESDTPNRHHSPTEYPAASYVPVQGILAAGDVYTWTVNGTFTDAEVIDCYFGGGSYGTGWVTIPGNGTHTITKTFTVTANQASHDNVFNVYVRGDAGQSSASGANSVIHWVKLEKGNKATDWSPAPEDFDQKLDDQKVELQSSIDTAIETSEDGIISTVTETFTTKDDFENEVGLLQTQLTQTQEDFTFQFNTVNSSLTDLDAFKGTAGSQLDTISKYIRFLNGDILLGGTDSDVQLKIENDRIGFLDNNNEVMYITNEELYIMRAIIATQLTIGNFSWVPRSNGNVSFRYIG